MRMYVLADDWELVSKFKDTTYFEKVNKIDINLLDTVKDLVVISDKILSVNKVLEFRENRKDLAIFYLVSNEKYNTSMKGILENNRINYIAPKQTISQIVEKVCKHVSNFKGASKNTIIFFGADSKVGTTSIAHGVAETIAKKSDKKVLLLLLDSNFIYEQEELSDLDGLINKIINRMITITDVKEQCIVKENLTILKGVRGITNKEYLHPVDIEYLINVLVDNFDIIITDIGANLQFGANIGALNMSDYKYLVTTQQESAILRYKEVKEQILDKLSITDYSLIVNKYIDTKELKNSFKLAEEYNKILVAQLSYLEFGWESENQKKTLIHFDNVEFNKKVIKLSEIICNNLGFKLFKEEKKTFIEKLFRMG